MMDSPYERTARYYDRIYAQKDYAGEVARLVELIGELPRGGRTSGDGPPNLLDVACGTGLHAEHLARHFVVEGLDIEPELLTIARERNPGLVFHRGDMTDFDLGRRFDVVTCLFSSIGYVRTLDGLRAAIGCLVRHVAPEGVLAIEPWFTPADWQDGTVHALLVDEPELKIARVNTSGREGRISFFDLHHLIGTPRGTEHVVERHELGLFERTEMVQVMEGAGLAVAFDAEGLTGRGLFFGRPR